MAYAYLGLSRQIASQICDNRSYPMRKAKARTSLCIRALGLMQSDQHLCISLFGKYNANLKYSGKSQ